MSIPKQFYMAADWSYLPADLVRLIGNRLPTIEDSTAFTAMCQSFRSATAGDKRPTTDYVPQPPWLLLSCVEKDSSGRNSPAAERGLLNMYRHRNKFLLNLPELDGRRCWGSRYGWILTLGLDRQLHLFNPLNRRRITLPEQIGHRTYDDPLWLPKHSIHRALLIKLPPSSSFSAFDDFTIATTGIDGFRVMRPDGGVEVKFMCSPTFVYDVISYKGQIYALSYRGRLYICSNFGSLDPPTASEFVAPDTTLYRGDPNFYVVESLGELLLVLRFRKKHGPQVIMWRYDTYRFDVYKLDFQTRKWTVIDTLGNCSLFVGGCESISLPRPEVYSGDDSFSSYSAPSWLVPSFT